MRELLDTDAVLQKLRSEFLCELKTEVRSIGIELVTGSATSVILLSSHVWLCLPVWTAVNMNRVRRRGLDVHHYGSLGKHEPRDR